LILLSDDLAGFHFDINGIFSEQTKGIIRRGQFGQTLSISHPLGRLTVAGELWHFTQPLISRNAVGNLWAVSYPLRKNLVVDAGFNHGLTSSSTQWEGFAGFTYLLPHRLWGFHDPKQRWRATNFPFHTCNGSRDTSGIKAHKHGYQQWHSVHFRKGQIMKTSYFTAVLTLTCLLGLGGSALARDKAHSVEISDIVQIGGTTLKPGNYKVGWQGTGPAVQVSFQQNGKTVVTAPGTLKTNDDQITQDAIVTEATGAGTSTLKEIDFRHLKQALVFDQNPAGM
jgi:hypothetical protein